MGTWADGARGPRLLGRWPRLVPAWLRRGKPLGSGPRGGESDAPQRGGSPGRSHPEPWATPGAGGINTEVGARALRGCDRSWVPATESPARARGRREGAGPPGPPFRTPAPTSSSLSGRVDALRDGTEEATLGGGDVKERSENLVPRLFSFTLLSCLCHGVTYRSDLCWALRVDGSRVGALKYSIHICVS